MEEIEYNQRVITLVEKLLPKGTADRSETDEMFMLYNMKFTPRETGKSCSGCRNRVYNRMKEYYNKIKPKE